MSKPTRIGTIASDLEAILTEVLFSLFIVFDRTAIAVSSPGVCFSVCPDGAGCVDCVPGRGQI
jgi:hypothetical protein